MAKTTVTDETVPDTETVSELPDGWNTSVITPTETLVWYSGKTPVNTEVFRCHPDDVATHIATATA